MGERNGSVQAPIGMGGTALRASTALSVRCPSDTLRGNRRVRITGVTRDVADQFVV